MKTIIIYATKSGASKECAELLSKRIDDCVLYDAAKGIPDLRAFDTIIIGSGVRMGKVYGPIRKLIDRNLNLLLSRNTAIYLCNAYPETAEKIITQNIPKTLVQSTISIESFGGKQPFHSAVMEDWVRFEKVDEFITKVRMFNELEQITPIVI